MTISSETRKAGPFNGNGVTTSFPFTFKVFAKTDIRVVLAMPSGTETDLVLDSNYSVTLNPDQNATPGGTITYPLSGSPLPASWMLTTVGNIQALQGTDLTNQGGFYPQVIEDALDRATILIQQNQEELARTLRFSVSDTAGVELPAAALRASKYLAFDAQGNPITVDGSAQVGDAQMISFTQAGTGAVTRTAQDKMREVVSVKDFGARSNTDSTVAIQAAFNSVTTDATVTIPAGKYIISANITLTSKTDFTLLCEGAEFVLAAGITGLSISNCLRLAVLGSLNFSGSATATGFTIAGCEDSSFHGFDARGLSTGGILQPPANATYGGVGVPAPAEFSGFSAKNCGTGLMVTGEYYNISGAEVKGCSSHGLRIQAGNVGVVGGQYIGNRIGIFIEGGISGNSDHGKIIGATVSHNLAAGIYVKNTLFSYHITGCEVWANIGDGTANGQLTEEGRVTSFGVYLQNCENINLTGNIIARNRVNVGIDGLVTSAVSANNFISDSARTTSHIKEYGANHSTFGVNAQNNYGHNVYDGALLGGSTKRLELLQTSSSIAHNTFGSVGTTGSRIVSLDSTVSGDVFVDGDSDFITLTSNCPATITLTPAQTFGQQFEVSYLQASVGATKSVTLLGASASTSILCAGVSLSGTTLTFKENGAYKFIPYGNGDGKWVVVRSGGFEAATAPTLTNSWTNLDAAQFTSAGFFKGSDGMVNLQGSLATTGTSGSSAFTLPVDYRPAKTVTIPIATTIGLTAFVKIDTAGLVMPSYGTNATFVSLDSVQFRPV